ncbi:DUF192 domain-containing protein [filamentous cyanobacterium CCP5]|nr:DUF192 domain-containing protein [filamentous cyanobacterium CCT1]PSN20582.1 DUF192 domain-containing protein [filamentous cyanobacterium CCP5]
MASLQPFRASAECFKLVAVLGLLLAGFLFVGYRLVPVPDVQIMTIEFNGHALQLEVARSHQEQVKGLMGRAELPDNQGMVFPVVPPRVVEIWMKDVAFPLDIIYLREGMVLGLESDATPCSSSSVCPIYSSSQVVDTVIELPGGTASKLGIKIDSQMLEP